MSEYIIGLKEYAEQVHAAAAKTARQTDSSI